MQTITIRVKNDNDISMLMRIAEQLGISIITKQVSKVKSTDNSDLFYSLHNFRKKNELFKGIENPATWQKEIRKERKLLNRE